MVARQLRIGTLIAPLFPRYLFVAFDKHRQRWRAIHSTRGVQRLFSSGPETPMPVPHGLVEAIRAGEAERLVVQDMVPAFIAAGAAVRVTDGPLVNHRGVCRWDAGTRVRILLSLFGRETEVTLPRQQVTADP
jgi:transcriptional antiterminator RfaH